MRFSCRFLRGEPRRFVNATGDLCVVWRRRFATFRWLRATIQSEPLAAIRIVEIKKPDPAWPTSSAAAATKLTLDVARFAGAGQPTSKARGAARMIE